MVMPIHRVRGRVAINPDAAVTAGISIDEGGHGAYCVV
jgi:hypothetical protein